MAIKNFKLNKLFNSVSNKGISKSWLYCRWVLYLLFVLAIGNIYYLLLNNDLFTLAIFILVAFLTTFFSKNMVVILCISLVISTILKSVQVKEKEGLGFELSKNDMMTLDKLVAKLTTITTTITEGNTSGNAKPTSLSIKPANTANTTNTANTANTTNNTDSSDDKKDLKDESSSDN